MSVLDAFVGRRTVDGRESWEEKKEGGEAGGWLDGEWMEAAGGWVDGRREDEGGGGEVGGLVMAAVVALVVVKREEEGGVARWIFSGRDTGYSGHRCLGEQSRACSQHARVVGTWRYLSGLYRQSNSPQAW